MIKSAPTDNSEVNDEIVTKDELLLGDWTPIRNEVWASSVLSDGAFRCYVAICSHVWKGQETKAWPGQNRLAELLYVSRSTISRYLKELDDVGLLKIERRGLNKTNVYYLLKPKRDALRPHQYTDVSKMTHQDVADLVHQDVAGMRHKEEEVEEQTVEEQSSIIPKTHSLSIPESFANASLSGTLDDDVLVYVQTIVDYFNGLKGRYPKKIRAKINRPVKRATVNKYKDGKYRAILKWYSQGIPANYICDLLQNWIPKLKTSVGGSLNYFENKDIDYISSEKQAELDAYKKKVLEEAEDLDFIK